MLRFPAHFSESEVRAASEGLLPPPQFEANAQRTLDFMEATRAYLGVPLYMTSFGRSPAHNAEIPGAAKDSQHMQWLAVDFDAAGMTNHEAAELVIEGQAAGLIPLYHQLITYETDGHVHVGVPGGRWLANLQNLVKTKAGEYVVLTQAKLAELVTVAKANPTSTALVLVILAGAFFFPSIEAREALRVF